VHVNSLDSLVNEFLIRILDLLGLDEIVLGCHKSFIEMVVFLQGIVHVLKVFRKGHVVGRNYFYGGLLFSGVECEHILLRRF
jgi:hypothetical protein